MKKSTLKEIARAIDKSGIDPETLLNAIMFAYDQNSATLHLFADEPQAFDERYSTFDDQLEALAALADELAPIAL